MRPSPSPRSRPPARLARAGLAALFAGLVLALAGAGTVAAQDGGEEAPGAAGAPGASDPGAGTPPPGRPEMGAGQGLLGDDLIDRDLLGDDGLGAGAADHGPVGSDGRHRAGAPEAALEAIPGSLFRKRHREPLPVGFFITEGAALTPEQEEAVRLNNEGVALMRRGRVEEAAERLRESLRKVPGYVNGLRNLAVAYKLKGDHTKARAIFEKVILLDPDDAEAHLGLALALWRLGEKEESAREQDRALELDPSLAPDIEAFRDHRFHQ